MEAQLQLDHFSVQYLMAIFVGPTIHFWQLRTKNTQKVTAYRQPVFSVEACIQLGLLCQFDGIVVKGNN